MYSYNPFKFREYVTRSPILPKCRAEPILYCYEGKLYSYSRYQGNLMIFDLHTRLWSYVNNGQFLIQPFCQIIGIAFRGPKLIILSFFGTVVKPRISNMHIFDLKDATKTTTSLSGTIPWSTSPTNFVIHNDYYYTIGVQGDNDRKISDVYRLSTASLRWECVYKCNGLDENEPPGRQGHTLVYDGRKIYIFRQGVEVDGLELGASKAIDRFEKIPAFDIPTRKWTSIETYGDESCRPSYPNNKRGVYALTYYTDPVFGHTNVIISGGEVEYNIYKDVWRLNLSDRKWTKLERLGIILPIPVNYHSMYATPKGQLFVYGGIRDQNPRCARDNCSSCISTVHSAWVTVPTLLHLCGKIIQYYHPNWAIECQRQVAQLGIKWDDFESNMHKIL